MMPPVNANGPLHIGHAVFVTIQDIAIRYQRMKGKEVLWLPGVDHAGFETQVVFEKVLEKQGKTRFQYSSQELYKMILAFTQKNRKTVREQLKKLGASCDWSKEKFTLDKDIIKIVYQTFESLYKEGLIYRGERVINWCPYHGTALSDLEVNHKSVKGNLWYIRYKIKKQKTANKNIHQNYITVATTRPETMLGDMAIAVNSKDKRYKSLIGQQAIIPLINRLIPIIADKRVDLKFGTGAVKITPAHDPLDFEIGKDHKLKVLNVIDKSARMTGDIPKAYQGLTTLECRTKIVADLEKEKAIAKVEDYQHQVSICYKCKTPIEPLVSKQWFLKTTPLAQPAIKAVKEGKIKFIPGYYKKIYFHWLKNIKDWNISRQIVWGIRIPIWYGKRGSETKHIIISDKKPKMPKDCDKLIPETDTFDTWFSSGQWPFATLLSLGKLKQRKRKMKTLQETTDEFDYFYPTSLMETGWDILFFWVARMVMLGIHITGKAPFRYVYLHGLVRDKDRKKMSKSKGNVIDPLGIIQLYGADALRMALVFGTGPGRDIVISEEKIIGQKKFANKIWNAFRFILMQNPPVADTKKLDRLNQKTKGITQPDKTILKNLEKTKNSVDKALDNFQFHQAAQKLYQFFWHNFCDKYLEASKKQLRNPEKRIQTLNVLLKVSLDALKLLHPFIPFITEEIYQKMAIKNKKKCLMAEKWPKVN